MQIQHPFRTVTAALDGDVLFALAQVEVPLTAPAIAKVVSEYSLSGVRKTLARLVGQGVVSESILGRTKAFALNMDHLATRPIRMLAELRIELVMRLDRLVEEIIPGAPFVALFGSAARGEMRIDSDIDLFLVRDEGMSDDDWEYCLTEISDAVRRWTGNTCNPVSYQAEELEGRSEEGLIKEVLRDGQLIVGDRQWLRRRLGSRGRR